MASGSYQEKLGRQFAGYVAGMILVFFAAFMVILLIYTMGINGYQNAKHNGMLANSFTREYDSYTEFLQDENTQELLLRRLAGEVSDNYVSYYYNSFVLTTEVCSGLILSDAEGKIVYCGVDGGEPVTHLRYFNFLVQKNLKGTEPVYHAVYSLYGDESKFVLAVPLYWKDGTQAGAAAIYIDGASWESQMRQEQFDGVITNQEGYIIAASNREAFSEDGINRFLPQNGRIYLYNGQKYGVTSTYLPGYQVYIHTLLKKGEVASYYIITLTAVSALLAALLLTARKFARRIADLNSRSLETLHEEISAIQEGNGERRIQLHTGDEFEDIADHINTMLDHLAALNDRNMELARLNSQMERLQLEAQFDPHFLYNTLESIRYAVHLGAQDVDGIILKLTALLRYSISDTDGPVVLREDLCHLRDYLDIIQYRFQSRFQHQIEIADRCLAHPCPKLCLQPIVENSVKYGLHHRKVLTVRIRGWEDEDFLYLEVRDDGTGMEPELLSEMQDLIHSNQECHSVHYGLKNIARRLALQFGAGSGMELSSIQDEGTTVLLRIAHTEVVQ